MLITPGSTRSGWGGGGWGGVGWGWEWGFRWEGWVAFLRLWPPSTMWKGVLCMAATVWLIPSFWIWGYVLHVEHFMCHHKFWPTSVSHPFSSINGSLCLAGGNITWKLLSISSDLYFKILVFQAAFLVFFSITIFSPYFLTLTLTFFWLVCYCNMWLCFSQGNS